MYNSIQQDNQIIKQLALFLTAAVVLFSIVLTASFWGMFAVNNITRVLFMSLGVLLELSKLCACITMLYGIKTRKVLLTALSTIVFAVLALSSVCASIGTMADQIKSAQQKELMASAATKNLQQRIMQQQLILDNLVKIQQQDLMHGYRARANNVNDKIIAEREVLVDLEQKIKDIKPEDQAFAKISLVVSTVLKLDQTQAEQYLFCFLGALLEFVGLFLIYVNFSVVSKGLDCSINTSAINYSAKTSHIDLPVSVADYQLLTKKLQRGLIKPTQRSLKNAASIGNEKIAKLFTIWLEAGIVQQQGKRYLLAS